MIVTLAFLTAGCRSQPVMVSEDGLHLTGTVSVPKRARVKVPKGRISLEEAVELALANSPQIRSADIGVKMGRAGVLGAMSGYLPQVQIQSTYHHVDALATSASPAFRLSASARGTRRT